MKSKIKIGLKLWSINIELFEETKKLFDDKMIDFIELYVIPGSFMKSVYKLKRLNIPMILHAPHSAHNFNPADKYLLEQNIKIFEEVKKFAKELNVIKIIVHPEYGNINSSFECLEKFNYKNIIIENMPKKGINGEECCGYLPNEIKLFLKKGFGFCLDLSHAYKAAISLNEEPKNFIKKFLKLDPYIFHLSNGHLDKEIDEHLNLWEGDFDNKFLKDCIRKNENKMVTLEVPKVGSSLANDIRNIKYFKNLII